MGIEIKDKVALITGGAQGIGLGIAKEYLNAGAKVVISDVNEDGLKTVTNELKGRFGANVHAIVADVTLEEDVIKMVAETVRKFGTIDILVNNAGTGAMNLFWNMSVAEWDMIMNLNVRGTFLCSREVVKVMLEKGVKGRIINMSSINGHVPTKGVIVYCASKAAISMFTKVAALELGPHDINMNAICPGYVMTPGTEIMFNLPGFKEAAMERSPKGRYGVPEDVAKVALFLASPYADWITGQSIDVDGAAGLMGLPMYYDELKKGGIIS